MASKPRGSTMMPWRYPWFSSQKTEGRSGFWKMSKDVQGHCPMSTENFGGLYCCLYLTWRLHHCSKQVDRSFEVTDVHQFKDAEFVAATKEILREFVLDLKESWHEIRFLIWVSASSGILGSQRLRVASKDSIQGSSKFIKVHQGHQGSSRSSRFIKVHQGSSRFIKVPQFQGSGPRQ